MSCEKQSSHNPLCSTLIFMFGALIGVFINHHNDQFSMYDLTMIGLATVAFHLTQIKTIGLFLKKH